MKLQVTLFFRKKLSQFNSIEEIFHNVASKLNETTVVKCFELPQEKANFLSILKNLVYVRKVKKGVCHITGHVNYVALTTGRKTILTIHDVNSSLYGNALHRFIIKLFWFWLPCIFAKRITVISQFSKYEVCKLVPFAKHKIRVIHNPVKKELVYEQKQFNSDHPLILHLGTKSNKNLENTIIALDGLSCTLMIIGKLNIDQQQMLDKYNINYINKYFIPYSEIIESYKNCDLVSFVSTYEGFGMPIIEAQAIGRPVLTSNFGAMAEVAGNGACLVNPYSPNEIRKGILRIISDESFRDNLIIKGLKNIERFKLEHITNQYLQLYKEISE